MKSIIQKLFQPFSSLTNPKERMNTDKSIPREPVATRENKVAGVRKSRTPQADSQSTDFSVKSYRIVSTRHYSKNILALANLNPDYNLTKKQLIASNKVDVDICKYLFNPKNVELIPEDNNPYDPQAIRVLADGLCVGYVKSGSCAHLRKVIARAGVLKIDCNIDGGPYKFIASEFDDETGKTEFDLTEDKQEFRVQLKITEKKADHAPERQG